MLRGPAPAAWLLVPVVSPAPVPLAPQFPRPGQRQPMATASHLPCSCGCSQPPSVGRKETGPGQGASGRADPVCWWGRRQCVRAEQLRARFCRVGAQSPERSEEEALSSGPPTRPPRAITSAGTQAPAWRGEVLLRRFLLDTLGAVLLHPGSRPGSRVGGLNTGI